MLDEIKDSGFYLLRIDFNSLIVNGCNLKEMMYNLNDNRLISIFDIAHNYLQIPFTNETKISYQLLYEIEYIKIKEPIN